MRIRLFSVLLLLLVGYGANAQTFAHKKSPTYVYPKEEDVLEKLDEWEDLKFGMLIHYGLYSYWGIVESWSICAEEADWIPRDSLIAYDDYKRQYWSAINKFNPVNLDPESWAKYGKEAGMNYVVFTTKHHDGFNMFDTKETDFSIMHGAFRDNPRKNITKEVFNAFRNEGYMIGAYYSKPDWHSQYYWWDRYATPNRNHNYNIVDNPWRWNKFKDFCYNQIEEIMNGDYGKIDILWLDGGWVYKMSEDRIKQLGRSFKGSPDIDMAKIAKMARKHQPGLLVVDRTIPGEFENYQTPERGVPEYQLTNPWESNIPLGDDWGYTPFDPYKTPAKVVHTLVEIVAKGGNFLLGIGPKADGTLPEDVIVRLQKIGEWTSKNGEAIYKTRATKNYTDGENTWFTESKDGKTVYAIYCFDEDKKHPKTITFKGNMPMKGASIKSVATGKNVNWKKTKDGGIQITVPSNLPKDTPAAAFSFRVQ